MVDVGRRRILLVEVKPLRKNIVEMRNAKSGAKTEVTMAAVIYPERLQLRCGRKPGASARSDPNRRD